MKTVVYRIQDNQGRGPFRPGVPEKWIDETRDAFPAEDLNAAINVRKNAPHDLHLGFGCKSTDELRQWVTESEYRRLRKLGYWAVEIDADHIWELENELIFGRKRNLRKGVRSVMLYA